MWPAGFQGELDEMTKRSCSECTCITHEEEKKHKLRSPARPPKSDDSIVSVPPRQCSSDVSLGMILPREPTKTPDVLADSSPPQLSPPGREGDGEKEGRKLKLGSPGTGGGGCGGGEDCGREKLQRHRRDVAGRVWIPDLWGQEELLKDWIDCAAFDSSLVPGGIMSARKALVEECRRANIWWATG